jgi:RimJ/RimL family protein N-acetyltransferase
VSVLKSARGRGFGARLFDRAVMHARNEGVNMVFIHALTENTAMLKIARNAGATVERDGSESEAYLQPAASHLDTRMAEMVEQQLRRDRLPAQGPGQAVLGHSGRGAGNPPGRARRPRPRPE